MKKNVLKFKHSNWSMIGPYDWNNTQFTIYEDLTIEIEIYKNNIYNKIEIDSSNSFVITRDEYNFLLKKIEETKNVDFQIDACDGTSWQITQYKNEKIIWTRKQGYIYGIKPLEEIEKFLINYENKILL